MSKNSTERKDTVAEGSEADAGVGTEDIGSEDTVAEVKRKFSLKSLGKISA
jgi:hypothetical protein